MGVAAGSRHPVFVVTDAVDTGMIDRSGTVSIWASELAAGDFPAICVMTGAPAETRRKFRFHTHPAWTFVFAFLICVGIGFFVSVPLAYLVSPRASGRLPLTRASARSFQTLTTISIVVTTLAIAMWVMAGILGYGVRGLEASNAALLLLVVGLPVLLFGLLGLEVSLQMTRPLMGPRGRVMNRQPGQNDRLVELSNLHPAFVEALNLRQQETTAQPDPTAPTLPGSI